MKKKGANRILLVLLLVLIILFLGMFIFKEPTITGVVVYEEEIKILNWTFDDSNDFSYDHSLVNLSDGEAKLIRSVAEYSWNADNFSEVYASSALEYEHGKKIHNMMNKIGNLDGDGVNINKADEIFDVAFNKKLSDGDIISLYILKSDDEEDDNENSDINVYVCDNGISCSEPGYGSVNLNGSEGWRNITIIGLGEAKDTFNIRPSKNTEFDYIKAVHKDTITHASANISYPKSASIETKDISIASLSSFLSFHKNDLLNDQKVNYSYSFDSGSSWASMPSNNNISDVPVSSGKIRIKADVAANGSETPVIYDFAVSYLTQICNENWNGTYESCLYDDNGQNETGVIQNETKLLIDKKQESNVLLELTSKLNISANSISIVEYSTNSKNSTPSLKELEKYIDITADDAIKQNLTTISIRIYYTDEDIANANLDEETLRIHYFNDTNNQWQILNSTVNTTGNYVEVTIEHLSTFGVFGDEKESQSSGSSGSPSGGSGGGGGGGGGKTRIIKEAESIGEKPVATETKEEIKKSGKIEELGEVKKECDYKISVSMPEHVSFVEHDYINGIIYNLGGCKIENLDIDISPELKGIIRIESEGIADIGLNESAEFLLIKKLGANKASDLLIQGFNIKVPKQNVKTYNGVLTFNAIVDEQLAFEEKINVKVDLLENTSIISAIGSKAAIFLVFLGLFAVVLFMFYSKSFQKKAGKLTRKQIGEIEEKVHEAERRYQNGKK